VRREEETRLFVRVEKRRNNVVCEATSLEVVEANCVVFIVMLVQSE